MFSHAGKGIVFYLLVDDLNLKLIWLSVYCTNTNSQLMMHACEGEKGLFVLLYIQYYKNTL